MVKSVNWTGWAWDVAVAVLIVSFALIAGVRTVEAQMPSLQVDCFIPYISQ